LANNSTWYDACIFRPQNRIHQSRTEFWFVNRCIWECL
jgi:hypothetical protein